MSAVDFNKEDANGAETHTDIYNTLLGQGVSEKVSAKLDAVQQSGLLAVSEFDERALNALKEHSDDDALAILELFIKSDLSHVKNKSAFLTGVMNKFHAKMNEAEGTAAGSGEPSKQGPIEEKVKELLDRTGYTLDITTGQRKYGGPPPNWEGPVPGTGENKFCSQIFIGKLPRDMYEDELVPLFEPYGTIYDLRIMMDPFSGLNKGYAFCTYTTKEEAQAAVKSMDKKEVRGRKVLGVCLSQANNRLFVGSIPKTKTKADILEEFSAKVEHVSDVILYQSAEDKTQNRGFAFLEFVTHKDAALARRRLMSGKIKVFHNIIPTVDWADPVDEPDEEVMAKIKVVYVRNLSPSIDETKLEDLFKQYGSIEKVKKVKDFAFINFSERDDALRAIQELNGQELEELKIEVSLAKPASKRRGMSGFGALGRGRGDRGGFSGFRGRGGGRGFPGYHGSYGGYGNGYGGYDGYGYDDYYGPPGPVPRGRGGPRGMPRGFPMGPPHAHSGGPPIRGRGLPMRGMGPRGMGPRGMGPRGGFRGASRGTDRGGASMLKRKADFKTEEYGSKKKSAAGGDGWGTQPIAQQPLTAAAASTYYSDDYGGGEEWYSHSYGGGQPSWS